ncbi:MAG: hypothetical protein GSR85_06920 [Desulfurococcales archaeon]|nr:hypothetical protein [Desulfurococcales archaeon]
MARQSLSLSKATHKVFIGAYYILLAFVIIGLVGWAASTAQSNTESFASIETGGWNAPTGATGYQLKMGLAAMEGYGEAIWEITVGTSTLELYHDGNGNWELLGASGGWTATADTNNDGIGYGPGAQTWYVDVNDLVYKIVSTDPLTYKVTAASNVMALVPIIDIVVVATALVNSAVGFLLIFKGVRLTGVRL